MELFQRVDWGLKTVRKTVLGLSLEIADWVVTRAEIIRIYIKNNELKQINDRNVALLGEKIFYGRKRDLSLLVEDPIFSQLMNKIVKDKGHILD